MEVEKKTWKCTFFTGGSSACSASSSTLGFLLVVGRWRFRVEELRVGILFASFS